MAERAIVRFTPHQVLPYVWHNPLFDGPWYLKRYPDVRYGDLVPERHYRRHGVHEVETRTRSLTRIGIWLAIRTWRSAE